MLRRYLIRVNGHLYWTYARSDSEAAEQARQQIPGAGVVEVALQPDGLDRVKSCLSPVEFQ